MWSTKPRVFAISPSAGRVCQPRLGVHTSVQTSCWSAGGAHGQSASYGQTALQSKAASKFLLMHDLTNTGHNQKS